jgi:DNA-directed RNA polymerase subunit K/omega
LQTYGKLDSKFRFVILASKRAKQLLKGAKVKIRTKSRNVIRIAQLEVKAGLIDYDIVQLSPEDGLEADKEVFTADDEGDDLDTGAAGGEADYEDETAEPEGEDEGELEELPDDPGAADREEE